MQIQKKQGKKSIFQGLFQSNLDICLSIWEGANKFSAHIRVW